MRNSRHHSPAEAGLSQTSQAACPSVPGSSSVRASFPIPFLPFSIVPFGLVALSDGHRVGEGKPACPNQDGVNPYRNGAK